jgi:hypothetical protein
MTVRAALTTPPAAPEGAVVANAPAAADTAFGIIVGGTPAGDVIVMSQRAIALTRAGVLVQALVIAGLASLRRTIALAGGRTLRLQDGIYRVL